MVGRIYKPCERVLVDQREYGQGYGNMGMRGRKQESIAETGGRAGVKIGIFKEMFFNQFSTGGKNIGDWE